ncbi:MAG: hypothetical protein K2X46_16785 [Roseomonas sp.]|jgi:hypothetical protein|nr:hypothetical protein [Roseomonas sp.]
MPRNVVVLLNSEEGRRLVRAKCRSAGIKIAVFERLVEAELERQGMMRRAGLWEEFDEILDEAAEDTEASQ